MAHQNFSESVTQPASGPLLRNAIVVALDRLRAWCRAEGVSWDQPADEDARLWHDLLMLTLDRMEDDAAPVFRLKVLTAASGINLPKRTWEKHQKWFDRNIRAVLQRSLADQGLPMIFPARSSSGIRGHSTRSQAAYFLSFQDFADSRAVDGAVADEKSNTSSRPDVGDPLALVAPRLAGQGNVDSSTAAVPGADDDRDAAGGPGGATCPSSHEETESTARSGSPGIPIRRLVFFFGLRISQILGLSLDAGTALTACVLPLSAALAIAMAISHVGVEISASTALVERIVTAIRDTLSGNFLPSFF
jgi:hypothetical protein